MVRGLKMRHNCVTFPMRARTLFLASLLVCSAVAAAQNPSQDQNIDTVHLTTKLGSFKLFNGSGHIHIDFKGTVLVTFLQGTITTSGNVKKEYPVPQAGPAATRDGGNRQAFHGDGAIDINCGPKGGFKSIQWFGRDMTCVWTGAGGFRLFGEYDKNLDTGYMWYGNNEATKERWPIGGGDLLLPKFGKVVKPVIK